MGAISFILYNTKTPPINMEFTNSFLNMKNRGPDDTTYKVENTVNIENATINGNIKKYLSRMEIANYKQYTVMYGYHRLSVNDNTKNGEQPFEDPIEHKMNEYIELRSRPKRKLLCNGEIYNYKELKESLQFTDKDLQSESDVEIILPLYIKYGLDETIKRINGDYTFVLTENVETYDLKKMNIYIVRDKLGIRPMYLIKDKESTFYMFTTELKGIPKYILQNASYSVTEMPPGTIWSFHDRNFKKYNDWNDYKIEKCIIKSTDPSNIAMLYDNIREKLTKSIMERYTQNAKLGVLLSGGFDSSIILSILVEELVKIGNNFEENQIHTFTVGDLQNSTDVKNALQVIEYLETKYKSINLNIYQHIVDIDDKDNMILSKLDDVIYTLETYDSYTIKGGIPFFCVCKYINEKTDVKILLTGEGLDEMCGYSTLFKDCDNTFQQKSITMIKDITKFDIMRIDKIAGFFGLEVRHPFLDNDFVQYMLEIHPKLKRPQIYEDNKPPIEKYIVRKAFDTIDKYLPHTILWRTIQDIRECFDTQDSIISSKCNEIYTDQDFTDFLNESFIRLDNNTKPKTKEDMHYRKIFSKFFGKNFYIKNFWNE